ncbi:MAG: pre-peptidase C-terminal domain-containing protein [Planctomycetaceae bacterium]|nr:pre-peptidase C-terminal domain-containing protein [Planctomycetaceae bacterium]
MMLPCASFRTRSLVLLLGCFGITLPLTAQLPQTRLYAISPSGCQVGQQVELRLTAGDDLEEIDTLVFSHPGITAKPLTTEQNGQQVPVNNAFVVQVAADVPPGLYDARCGGLFGLSNPRRFVVGQRAEVAEAENNKPEPAEATAIELNTVVNGKMDGGADLDWFKFHAAKDQRITIDCWAERIDSRMDPTLTVYDASGRRPLAVSRDARGADPLIVFTAPTDGDYLIKLHDHIFKNGNEYVYRLDVHTAPHIAFVVPPAGTAGQTARMSLFGVNLPGGKPTDQQVDGVALEQLDVEIAIPETGDVLDVDGRVRGVAAGTDAFSYRLNSPQGLSAPVRVGIARTPVVRESEPNDAPESAQKVAVPVEIGGQFGQRGDTDTFRFEAKAGDVLWLEAYAQRMGTLVDPYFTVDQVVIDAEGKESLKRLSAADDDGTNLLQNVFETKTDDPQYKLTVPADGQYQITLRDRYWETRGDASLVYRMAIRQETPNFRVVAVPAAPTAGQVWPVGLRQGDTFGVNVLAFRQDGFEGPIDVQVEGLPAGVTCTGTTISTKESTGLLVFETSADAQPGWHRVKIRGVAQVDDPVQVRAVDAAAKAIEAAEKPLPDLRKQVDQQQPKLDQAKQQLDETTQALAKDPENEGLKKQLEQRQTAFNAAQEAFNAAANKVAEQEQLIAQSKTAHEQALQAQQQSRREIAHQARSGTIVWANANNQPAVARVAEGFAFSILPEPVAYQVRVDGNRFEVNQSRQLLIPVSVQKRNEFNEKVQLNAAGMPKAANIETPNIAIEKDQTDQTWRLFVKDNAPAGTYTVWLNAQAQVSYSRNPAKAERLKQAHEVVQQAVEALKTAAGEATKVKNEATQKATAAQQQLQKSQQEQQLKQQAKQQADQQLAQAKQAQDQADAQLAAAEKEVQTRAMELQATEEQVKSATATQEQAATQLKQAQEAAAADPENAEKKAAVEAAQQTVNTAQQQLNEATQARDKKKTEHDQAQQKKQTAEQAAKQTQEAFTKLEAEQKQADEALAAATKAVTAAETASKATQEAKTAAEQAEKAANDAVAAREKERQAAEKAFKDAETAAKPKNINYSSPTTPVVIVVHEAPIKLAVTAANGGAVKRGDQLELTVKVTRQNGFEGPVTVTFPGIPGVTGMSAPAITIPPDQTEGKLMVAAAGDATEGQLANTVVRAEMDFQGKAAVDAPVTIKVNK